MTETTSTTQSTKDHPVDTLGTECVACGPLDEGTQKAATVGEAAFEKLSNFDTKQNAIDTQREADKTYLAQVQECIDRHTSFIEACGEDGAFIVVLVKKERHMPNVLRRFFFVRKTLPTPEYDQTVWRFNHKKRPDLEFIWCIPDKDTCYAAVEDRLNVPKEEAWVVETASRLLDGTLRDRAKKVFGIEEPEAQLLLNR